MKRVLLLLFLASSAHAAVSINGSATFVSTITVQGSRPVLSTSTLQSGTTLYVSSGTINQLFVSTFSALSVGPSRNDFSIINSSPIFGSYLNPATLRLNSHTSQNHLIMSLDGDTTTLGFRRYGRDNSSIIEIGRNSLSGGMVAISQFYIGDGSSPWLEARSLILNTSVGTQPPTSGTLGLYGYSKENIGSFTPTAEGQIYYCTNCSSTINCVSTATTRGGYAAEQATNRTTACQ